MKGMSEIVLKPLSLKEANTLVKKWHSHHNASVGHKFSIGALKNDQIVGAVIVGRPVSSGYDDGYTFEVIRLVTNGENNVASRLLGAAWRASKAMGVKRLVSYTRIDEKGTSFKAAGFEITGKIKGRAWKYGNKELRWLPGLYTPTTKIIDRIRWELKLKTAEVLDAKEGK
jgi:hypothetical protein